MSGDSDAKKRFCCRWQTVLFPSHFGRAPFANLVRFNRTIDKKNDINQQQRQSATTTTTFQCTHIRILSVLGASLGANPIRQSLQTRVTTDSHTPTDSHSQSHTPTHSDTYTHTQVENFQTANHDATTIERSNVYDRQPFHVGEY